MNPLAVGGQGELGLFQLKPQFSHGYSKQQLLDPIINIQVGLLRLREEKQNCVHKRRNEWLVCYNYGRNAAKQVRHPELFPYVVQVEKRMREAGQ